MKEKDLELLEKYEKLINLNLIDSKKLLHWSTFFFPINGYNCLFSGKQKVFIVKCNIIIVDHTIIQWFIVSYKMCRTV